MGELIAEPGAGTVFTQHQSFFPVLPLLAANVVASIVLGGLTRNHVLLFSVSIYVR